MYLRIFIDFLREFGISIKNFDINKSFWISHYFWLKRKYCISWEAAIIVYAELLLY